MAVTDPMPLPGLQYQQIPLPGGSDPTAIVQNLQSFTGLEPRADARGNLQSLFRVDELPDGSLVLTCPAVLNAANLINWARRARPPAPPTLAQLLAPPLAVIAADTGIAQGTRTALATVFQLLTAPGT